MLLCDASEAYLTTWGAMTLQGPHQVAKQSRTMSVSLIAIASLKSSILKARLVSIPSYDTGRRNLEIAGESTHFKRLWTPSFLSLTLDILLVDAKGLGGVGIFGTRSGREMVVRGLSLEVRRRVDVSVLPIVREAGVSIVYVKSANETAATISKAKVME